MRNKLFITIAVMFIGISAFSQTTPVKIGYTDVDYILGQMPEAKQVEADLGAYQKQLANQLQAKSQEFDDKLEDYKKKAEGMTQLVREDRENELRNLQNSIQKFQKDADESLQKRQAEALKPLYDKIQKAIDEVAKENGYTYILSSYVGGVPLLLYATEQDNVSDLIFKKLGVTPPAAGEKVGEQKPVAPSTNTTTKPANQTPANTTKPAGDKPKGK